MGTVINYYPQPESGRSASCFWYSHTGGSWQKTTKFDMRMWRYRLLVSSFLRCGQRKTWSGHWRTTEGYSVVRQWPDGCQRLTACCQTKVKKEEVFISPLSRKKKRGTRQCAVSVASQTTSFCVTLPKTMRGRNGEVRQRKALKSFSVNLNVEYQHFWKAALIKLGHICINILVQSILLYIRLQRLL